MISSSCLPTDPFAPEPLLTQCTLATSKKACTLKALVDTGATGYAFIDENTAHAICDTLDIEPIRLPKPKPIRGFDGKMARPVTHAIYPSLKVHDHYESTAPMLITRLGQHQIILGKPWMNKHHVQLDMGTDKITFAPGRCTHFGAPSPTDDPVKKSSSRATQPSIAAGLSEPTPQTPSGKEVPRYIPPHKRDTSTLLVGKVPTALLTRKLYRRHTAAGKTNLRATSTLESMSETPFEMNLISGAAFHSLARDKETKFGALSMYEINQAIRHLDRSKDENALSLNEMDSTTREELKHLVPQEYHDFLDVFDRTKADELPPHRPYDHKIELTGEGSLPRSRLRPISDWKLKEVKKYLEENLQKGFIVPSCAPYASPILFAEKKDGSLRFCVDYRKLNQLTKKDRYPLPLIEETLARVTGAKYLTRLDIIAAFNKLRMHPDSEDFTTFITSLGAYKYKVLPFGLTNGPASYQHYMNDILFDYLNEFCQAYLDDILIYSKTRKDHIRHVRLVLQRLRDAGLQVDIKKCEFSVQETAFLGLLISIDGLRMDPKKIEAIVQWTPPTNLKEVQGFVGFCNFYRRFIQDFSRIVRPLTKLTQKDVLFDWSEACKEAFLILKKAVTEAPILRHFDRSKEAILETDSSDYVNGGILSQLDNNGVLHPVAFYSKNLLPAECNYEIYDKELLAIIRCLENWRPELESTELPVRIFTDHKSLEYFMESKELTRRQARWSEKLADFNFKITYRPGKQNDKADALTRMPGSTPPGKEDIRQQHQNRTILTPDRLDLDCVDQATPLKPSSFYGRVQEANRQSVECNEARQALAEGKPTSNGVKLAGCINTDGLIFKGNALWVPSEDQWITDVIRECHDPPVCGHPGIRRTMELVKRHYYWYGMKASIERYIANCYSCHRSKAPRDKANGLLVPLPIPEQRWKDISLDFITGLPMSNGQNAILAIVDRLSKERHYVPCLAHDEGTSAEETAMMLLTWVFRLHGLPETIVSDRGPQFVSTVWKSLCKRLGISSNLSTAFHPQTDGQTERANQDVERQLRTYCNYMQDDWTNWLPIAEFADNNLESSSTKLTPFYANKGYHPRMNFSPDSTKYASTRERLQAAKAEDISNKMDEVLEHMKENLRVSRTSMETFANRKRKNTSYEVGDRVFLSSKNITTVRPSKKLDDKMLGPFTITKKVGLSYQLELPVTMKVHNVFHPSLLRKAVNNPLPGQRNPPPPPVQVDEEDEWEIDDIEDARYYRGRLQYRVKWSGFERDLTWYNADDEQFNNARDVVNDFHSHYPGKPGPGPPPQPGRRRS